MRRFPVATAPASASVKRRSAVSGSRRIPARGPRGCAAWSSAVGRSRALVPASSSLQVRARHHRGRRGRGKPRPTTGARSSVSPPRRPARTAAAPACGRRSRPQSRGGATRRWPACRAQHRARAGRFARAAIRAPPAKTSPLRRRHRARKRRFRRRPRVRPRARLTGGSGRRQPRVRATLPHRDIAPVQPEPP